MLALATVCYALSCAVGIAAALGRRRLGALHHAFFAATCVSTVLALLVDFRLALLGVMTVLIVFPAARPYSRAHVLLALVGALGHGLAWWR